MKIAVRGRGTRKEEVWQKMAGSCVLVLWMILSVIYFHAKKWKFILSEIQSDIFCQIGHFLSLVVWGSEFCCWLFYFNLIIIMVYIWISRSNIIINYQQGSCCNFIVFVNPKKQRFMMNLFEILMRLLNQIWKVEYTMYYIQLHFLHWPFLRYCCRGIQRIIEVFFSRSNVISEVFLCALYLAIKKNLKF